MASGSQVEEGWQRVFAREPKNSYATHYELIRVERDIVANIFHISYHRHNAATHANTDAVRKRKLFSYDRAGGYISAISLVNFFFQRSDLSVTPYLLKDFLKRVDRIWLVDSVSTGADHGVGVKVDHLDEVLEELEEFVYDFEVAHETDTFVEQSIRKFRLSEAFSEIKVILKKNFTRHFSKFLLF